MTITEVLNEMFLMYTTCFMMLFTEMVSNPIHRYELGKIFLFQVILAIAFNIFFIIKAIIKECILN